MISIGSVLKGPELRDSEPYRLIGAIMRVAAECTGSFQFATGPAINVVFHVPGSLGAPDWDGVRDATFSQKRQLLMVQVAVPPTQVSSPRLREYLFESLHRANAVAFEFFRKKGLSFPVADAEILVEKIKARLDKETVSTDGHPS